MTRRAALPVLLLALFLSPAFIVAGPHGPLDPAGAMHIPIGLPNTLDGLKTYVEAEGDFSPGFGSYGIYFWIYDSALHAPTSPGANPEHGLAGAGLPIPWTRWHAGALEVTSEVCEVRRPSPGGEVFVAAARVSLTNRGTTPATFKLYAALRSLGPAGWPVRKLALDDRGDALLVDDHLALLAQDTPTAGGVVMNDEISDLATAGRMPTERAATSPEGNCSGALCFDLTLAAGASRRIGFVCPVLPGRRVAGHRWDGKSPWAQLDLNDPNPATGGTAQPDPGLAFYGTLSADALFDEARAFWTSFAASATIHTPDARWDACFNAIGAHVALAMNEDAPDVTAVNYNVFNRDGVYVTNILQKSGHFDLAAKAIDYFLQHPFNGRAYPEADNPGQVLWILGEHWRFTRDAAWLARVYPSAHKLAAMIRYYRTTPGPHFVSPTSLDFGDALPPDQRQELKPGRCDGTHFEYTEAFDIAGLRAAAALAAAAGHADDATASAQLADALFEKYDARFGNNLRRDYGSYCVLWPCRLYPTDVDKAHDQFAPIGAQRPTSWRYFPLATAHQGLLAGNREAGYGTLAVHLDHPQMAGGADAARGWYAFDEGGDSGPGNWTKVRTTWRPAVAMPHGWAIAEMHLLLRDCLLHEDADKLVLLAGVPPEWFRKTVTVEGLPTAFGRCSFVWKGGPDGATLTFTADAAPPSGYVLRLPPELHASVADNAGGSENGPAALTLAKATREVRLRF